MAPLKMTTSSEKMSASADLAGGNDGATCGNPTELLLLSGLPPPTLIAGFHDIAVMCDPVQQSFGHFGIPEDLGPFGEVHIGGDDDWCCLVEL